MDNASELALPFSAADVVMKIARGSHEAYRFSPITGPDEDGRFPPSEHQAAPVVVDANRLCQDMRRSVRDDERTVLVTAAHRGAIRLFCAQHVIEECFEHTGRWAADAGVDVGVWIARFQAEYLPLLRVVEAPTELLTSSEAERIRVLSLQDPDDVPTVRLAMVLGAFLLTEDRRAAEAAYGPDVDHAACRNWVEVLKAGGDAGALLELRRSQETVAAVAARLAFLGVSKAWRAVHPAAVVAFCGGVTWLSWRRVSPSTWGKLVGGLSAVAEAYLHTVQLSTAMAQAFQAASVPPPSWADLPALLGARNAAIRRSLHLLARLEASTVTASELAVLMQHAGEVISESQAQGVLTAFAIHVGDDRFQLGRQARAAAAPVSASPKAAALPRPLRAVSS